MGHVLIADYRNIGRKGRVLSELVEEIRRTQTIETKAQPLFPSSPPGSLYLYGSELCLIGHMNEPTTGYFV
jgi:hypothetical protein